MTGAERIETILAEQRCRDVHAERWRGAKGVHRVCESCTGWGKHVAVLVAAETGGVPASPELTCGDCRLPYATWFADNEVWNLVIGGPEAKGDPGGMLCPRCFTLRAEKVYELAIWHLRLDRVNQEPVAAAETGGGEEPRYHREPESLEGLLRWKSEALQVLGEWERVYDALGRPGRLGASKAASVLTEVERLRAAETGELADVAAELEKLRLSNPMNGDGSNYMLDKVQKAIGRMAGLNTEMPAATEARAEIEYQRDVSYCKMHGLPEPKRRTTLLVPDQQTSERSERGPVLYCGKCCTERRFHFLPPSSLMCTRCGSHRPSLSDAAPEGGGTDG